MSEYRKEIQLTPSGMVIARVYRRDISSGYSFFHGLFDNTEKRFQKAHKWADNLIELCEKYEINKP